MNFLDKINNSQKNDRLSFLEEHEFVSNETCGYGCCKGYFRGFHSSNKLNYNRLTVFISEGSIVAVNHSELDVGGHNYDVSNSIELEDASDQDILELINDTLPDDLD